MSLEQQSRLESWTGRVLLGAVVVLGLPGLRLLGVDPEQAALLAALASGAVLAAGLATRGSVVAAPRLALSFVLVAVTAAPAAVGVLVGVAALLAGSGGGVAGRLDRRPGSTAGVAAGLTLVGLAGFVLPRFSGWGLLLYLVGAFVVIELLAFLVPELLPGRSRSASVFPRKPQLLLELANVPLAWLVLRGIERAAWVESLVLGTLILLAQAASRRLARSDRTIRKTHAELQTLIAELDTLHAIGREILSCLEPKRLGQIIDRECRKIFDVEHSLIALSDENVSERGYRGFSTSELPDAACRSLARRLAQVRHGLVLRDDSDEPADRNLFEALESEGLRSVVAVPMIVEDRVIGVLALFSVRLDAYDEHQQTLLTTIAQQTAVALENARHFEMATVDSLTGFFLRDYFFGRLEEEIRRARRYEGTFSLLMLDLDGFKKINDRHGHPAGDAYLRSIGKIIDAQLRSADLGCRYGGDEFCLLLPETGFDGARTIAERIRRAVSSAVVVIDGTAIRATASIGLATFPDHGTPEDKEADDAASAQRLLGKADEALYQAKRAGRDCVVAFAA